GGRLVALLLEDRGRDMDDLAPLGVVLLATGDLGGPAPAADGTTVLAIYLGHPRPGPPPRSQADRARADQTLPRGSRQLHPRQADGGNMLLVASQQAHESD